MRGRVRKHGVSVAIERVFFPRTHPIFYFRRGRHTHAGEYGVGRKRWRKSKGTVESRLKGQLEVRQALAMKQIGSEYSPRLWRIHELLEGLRNRVRHQVEAPSMSSCLSNIAERDEHEEPRKACDNRTKNRRLWNHTHEREDEKIYPCYEGVGKVEDEEMKEGGIVGTPSHWSEVSSDS